MTTNTKNPPKIIKYPVHPDAKKVLKKPGGVYRRIGWIEFRKLFPKPKSRATHFVHLAEDEYEED